MLMTNSKIFLCIQALIIVIGPQVEHFKTDRVLSKLVKQMEYCKSAHVFEFAFFFVSAYTMFYKT